MRVQGYVRNTTAKDVIETTLGVFFCCLCPLLYVITLVSLPKNRWSVRDVHATMSGIAVANLILLFIALLLIGFTSLLVELPYKKEILIFVIASVVADVLILVSFFKFNDFYFR